MWGGNPDNKFLMHKDPIYDKMRKIRQEKNAKIEKIARKKRAKEAEDGEKFEKSKKPIKYPVDTYPFNRPESIHINFS